MITLSLKFFLELPSLIQIEHSDRKQELLIYV